MGLFDRLFGRKSDPDRDRYRKNRNAGQPSGSRRNPATGASVPATSRPAEPVTLQDPVAITYTNAKGAMNSFTIDRASIRVRGAFLSALTAPTGTRLCFRIENIAGSENLAPVAQEAAGAVPGPVEARVLRFHARRGTRSPLYDSLADTYRDWMIPSNLN